MFERRTGENVPQLGLDHGAQITGRVVPKFDYFAGLALENYNHAASDLGR
jgi:hypothetical protein